MKILLVNEGNIERAGVCLFMLQWCQSVSAAMPAAEFSAYFRAGVKDYRVKDAFEKAGVKIYTGNLPIEGTSADKANRENIDKDLRSILREGFNIIHIHSSVLGFTAIVLRVARQMGIPIRISHAHGKFDEGALSKKIHDVLRIYISHSATVYAGCAKAAGRYMFGERGLKSDKWIQIPNAIDTERFSFDEVKRESYRKEIGVSPETRLFGAVGYLEDVKNHVLLIDAMAAMKDRGRDDRIIILGEGSLRGLLEERIKSFGLDGSVTLYGIAEDVPGWLSAMDAFLMPSLSEGFPVSAVEAQTSGLPCLLSDRITKEVDMGGYVRHIPVDNATRWVEEMLDIPCCTEKRFDGVDRVKRAGYDRNHLGEYAQKLYWE